ncbi:hypothetical protein ACU8V3_09685 [Cobetia marina]
MLFEWKTQHEELVSSRLGVEDCSSFNDLKTKVARLLVDNHEAWQSCGPESEIAMNDPGSNIHELWDFKKISLIIPKETLHKSCRWCLIATGGVESGNTATA